MRKSPAENPSWLDPRQRAAFEAAMASSALWPIERRMFARGIVRQLRFNPRVERDFPKYGPTGVVQLNSARVIGLYMFGVGLLGLPFAWAGATGVAVAIYTVMGLLLVGSMARVLSTNGTGRRWRDDGVE